MSSKMPGAVTSYSEVTSITLSGFWLLVDDTEYFVPFREYPAFHAATVAQICTFQRLGPGQLYWPELDVDIELEALQHPERFPLKFRREVGDSDPSSEIARSAQATLEAVQEGRARYGAVEDLAEDLSEE